MEVQLTDANFEDAVEKSAVPVLVDFWATWCGPCQMLGPVLAEVAAEREGRLVVGKVNVDEAPGLAARFGIASIPALILFVGGRPVANSVGYLPKEGVDAFLAASL